MIRYFLKAADGRMAGYHTRTGAFLTANTELAYVWDSPIDAAFCRPLYERAFGLDLTIEQKNFSVSAE